MNETTRKSPAAKVAIGAITALVAIIVLVVAFNAWTIVGVGKEKVGATFGKVHESALGSGFYIVNPLADFERYDLQEVTYTWEDLGVPAQDNLKTSMDVAITGHFISGMTANVRENIGSSDGFMASQVNRRVPAMIVEVGKELAVVSQDFYGETTLARMETEIKFRLNKELQQRGYQITTVKFSDINLPQVVTAAIVKTKQRQQEVNEQLAKLKIADLQAQEKTAEAQAASKSAAFNATAAELTADAELYRIQRVAEGNLALSASVTDKLIELKEAQAGLLWNGVMPTTMLGATPNVLMNLK
jgi:regulator of protease activity HflC (stomatin/prohibitin superfamily)|tara:strand:+ start:44 stop:949 length:906 start_codon:yes stop_codon:yes gene_type:complete